MENERRRETLTGVCAFCGQERFVEHVHPDTPQKELDEIATNECTCDEAQIAREVRNSVEAVKRNVHKKMSMPEELQNAVEGMLYPVATGQAIACTIKVDDDTTIKIRVTKGRLICTRTVKEDTTVNEIGEC